jgi:hypothetical protein
VNGGSLDEGEQVRWQFDVPEEGVAFNLRVDQGRVEMYASTKTTSPNEAFHEWQAETSSSARVFLRPMAQAEERKKRNIDNINGTTIPVFMAITGLESNNTFTLQSGKLFPYFL